MRTPTPRSRRASPRCCGECLLGPTPGGKLDIVDFYQTVTAGHFEALGTPIVVGRRFDETDRLGAPVAIVNETFARTFWNGLDPVGRRVKPRFGDTTPWIAVIGVAKDVTQRGVDQPTGTELFFLLDQWQRVLGIRTR